MFAECELQDFHKGWHKPFDSNFPFCGTANPDCLHARMTYSRGSGRSS